jgi:predicted CoA-substrate-specific enzyme activase
VYKRQAIDIGGQDAKGIKIANGKVVGFVMNDKCAAGTGRFLEVMAEVLGLQLDQMGELSLKSKKKVQISSTCTVFAEQEVVSRIAEGTLLEDILGGINEAIASRVCRMAQRLKIERDVVVTGGVAKNKGVVKALEDYLGFPVLVPEEPLLTGAIGAALMGRELTQKALESGQPIERKIRRLEAATFFE